MFVVIFIKILSPLKTRFGCFFYCVSGGGDFAGSPVRKVSHLPTERTRMSPRGGVNRQFKIITVKA